MILAFSLILANAYSQKIKENEVPEAIKSGFKKNYPGVKTVTWEKENGEYEAEFRQDKKEIAVLLDNMGVVKEVETEITASELPKTIRDFLAKDYADYKIEEAARIKAADVQTYEAEVEKGKETVELIFDASGKMLEKKIKKDED